jgi:hypothetical protein
MKRLMFASLAAAVVTVATAGVRAQSGGAQTAAAAPQRNWYSVTLTTVKPERTTEWVEIQKSQTIPMQQKGGIKSRETWQSGAPFGEGNSYGIVTPIDKFATYDLPPLALRILGDAPGRAYQSKLAALTESRRTFAVQDRAELSNPPSPTAKIVAAILQDVTIVNGHGEQYEASCCARRAHDPSLRSRSELPAEARVVTASPRAELLRRGTGTVSRTVPCRVSGFVIS